MKRWAILLPVVVCWSSIIAQSWRALGRGKVGNNSIQTIYGDSHGDRLLIGGDFVYILNDTDTVLAIGQASWNGFRWDSLAHRIQPWEPGTGCAAVRNYITYEGGLYAIGTFPLNDGLLPWNVGLARLNEENRRWERLECVKPSNSGLGNLVPADPVGSSLYLTGLSTSICGYPQSCVFRYDGSAFHIWEPWNLIPEHSSNWARFVFDFRGHTYLTGQFRDPLGPGFVSFLRWNGASWEYVPGWGAYARSINDMSIRNDTLYVSGNFRIATGGPGNCIAYFDGAHWNDMGGGVSFAPSPANASCLVMQWHRDALWVSGQMDHAGGIPIDGVAKWNGRQWCSVPGDFHDPIGLDRVLDITVWRDSLYVCGGFISIDGAPIRHVAQWIGGDAVLACSAPVGVPEPDQSAFGLSPNPVRDRLRIQGSAVAGARFEISDATGRLVRAGALHGNEADAMGLRPGAYHLLLRSPDGGLLWRARFIKE